MPAVVTATSKAKTTTSEVVGNVRRTKGDMGLPEVAYPHSRHMMGFMEVMIGHMCSRNMRVVNFGWSVVHRRQAMKRRYGWPGLVMMLQTS